MNKALCKELAKYNNPLGDLCGDILADENFPWDKTDIKKIEYLHFVAEINYDVLAAVKELESILTIK